VKESWDVRFLPGPPPHLEIRSCYTLVNSGNSDLKFIDVGVPGEDIYGRQNVRVEWNGNAAPVEKPAEPDRAHEADTVRITADPVWGQKQQRELLIAYNFVSPEADGARITLGENEFHLGVRGWSPVLLPLKRILSPLPTRPDKTMFTIRVPADFKVLARGKPSSDKKVDGGETEHRFVLRKTDLPPYVVAGRYTESSAKRGGSDVIFWTPGPLKDPAAAASEQIGGAWQILGTNFGVLEKSIRTPHIVESVGLRAEAGGREPTAAAFPGGVLINSATLGTEEDEFMDRVTYALAQNWFGDQVYFLRNAEIGMGRGLPEYAAIVVDEVRGGDAARRKRVIAYLHEYDEAGKNAAEKPLASTLLTDTREQRRMALAKAPLFYVALEDEYGAQPVRQGLERMTTLLRGQQVGYDDMRAAIEMTTGKQLAKPFSTWIDGKDLPADFRARYEGGSETIP
jgi:hypothetical protein